MRMVIKKYVTYAGIAILGGIIAFAFHYATSLLIATSIDSVTVVDVILNVGTGVLVLLGGVAMLVFSKNPARIPVFCFALGFVLINKVFEWVFIALA